MEPSRQVQRAEFRAEVKRGESLRKEQERARRQLKLEKRKAEPSSLRIVAGRAVSKLSRSNLT